MTDNQKLKPYVTRWQGTELPDEHTLQQQMLSEHLSPYAWSNGPRDQYAVHQHTYHKILYCVRGSIRFTLPDIRDELGEVVNLDLERGDRMFLPSGVRHSASVGPLGVTCLEAPHEA
ncbi:hypothetical protein [Ktedonospora formicarum]|uniref:Cupin domain-containing protein n=1 Tax=Ktedonospora formicarum TaxID=2778364 RepID=A0A8J3I134_9CHLR|nr:hypothetical protein [Ktedonospora formicarum]GHO44302.1 hypothetical protein KSX_24650 [Ktedonospora formicarum]